MIARNSVVYKNKKAIVDGDICFTYHEYKKLCDQCAYGLVNEGIESGDRIAIISMNSEEYMILYGAVAKIGAVIIPINYRLAEGEIIYILQDTKPKIIITSMEYKEIAYKMLSMIPSIQKVFVSKITESEHNIIPFRNIFSSDSCNDRIICKDDNSEYIIIYTAAVNGKPRGCVLSQRNIISAGMQMAQLFNLKNEDCYVGTLPLFHIGGLAMTMAIMYQGGKNVIMQYFDPFTVLNLVEKERGTFFGTFPPMLSAILDAQEKQNYDLSSLRGVGGIDNTETIIRFLKNNPQATFFVLYGQTEAMPISGCDVKEKQGSIGRPSIMTRISIVDDLEKDVPVGEEGEICVRSPSVFIKYLNLEKETEYTFRGGWHHTGDRGRLDEEGYLYYCGRNPEKELIKSGGENVYPAEVERAILGHEEVKEVSVIGIPDPQWGEAVLAVCVLKEGASLTEDKLIEFVANKIARYKKPKHVIFVDNLPKKDNGQIDREEVKKLFLKINN